MSALDDAYEAACQAGEMVWIGATWDDLRGLERREAMYRATVDAFLAHLADNPPDEMVDTAIGWLDEVAAEADAGTLEKRDCQKDAEGLLSAALRSIGGER